MSIKKSILLFSLALIFPLIVGAVTEISTNNNLLADIKPLNPAPGQIITITLTGYGFDLDGSYINWLVDGQSLAQAVGRKQFSFTMGKIGTQSRVDIIVETNSGEKIQKTLIFQPSSVKMLWQTNTYTPPFYRGKALLAPGSTIKVLAIPKIIDRAGQVITKDKLSFRWKMDGNYLPDSSGLGRDALVLKTKNDFEPVKISVTVINPTDNATAESDLSLIPQQPYFLFYEYQPLTGVNYSQVINSEYQLAKPEITVKAEPYFFTFQSPSDLTYHWLVNSEPIPGSSEFPFSLTLREKEGTSGVNKISLTVSNTNQIFQQATASFLIYFGQKNTNLNYGN